MGIVGPVMWSGRTFNPHEDLIAGDWSSKVGDYVWDCGMMIIGCWWREIWKWW